MHGANFLAITNNYAGFVSLPTGQKPPSCASALKQCGLDLFMHARFLAHRVRGTSMSRDDCDNVRRYVDVIDISPHYYEHCNLRIGVNDNTFEKKHSRRMGFGNMLFTCICD